MSWEIAIAVVCALLLLIWWRVPKQDRPRKKFLRQLHDAKPITPKHLRPVIKHKDLYSRDEHLFFEEFAEFADVVNWSLSSEHEPTPWRLQQRADTKALHHFTDHPILARRYDVFHNQALMGQLELSAGYPYEPPERTVRASVELMFTRLLALDDVRRFLGTIAEHVCSVDRHAPATIQAYQAIQHSLLSVVWES